MPTRIDLDKDLVRAAFQQRTEGLKRQIGAATNKAVKVALEDELAQITKALDTMADTK